MKLIHVTVMVQGQIWDEILISQDHVLFITFRSSDFAHLELWESIKAKELIMLEHKCATPLKFNNSILNINGQDIMEKVNKLDISSHEEGDTDMLSEQKFKISRCVQKLYINGYLLSLFVKTLQRSEVYRRSVVKHFKECIGKTGRISHPSGIIKVNMKLVCPHKHIIDFSWNERIEKLVLQRRELDNAMSWLSTLGGAFSALGEEFKHCAEIAGRISVKQFNIALSLGDPTIVARCKLYLALSLVQRGHLVPARRIIEQQYYLACSAPVLDTQLISICLGIWAKLKYEHHRRRTEQRGKK
ncbi:hypothetical protein B7P43_G08043 [Cryptotermes secundus]|uniref:Uncharacterized protein n=2 Tax=Cryptotermes secundus TaxID=105785 RepID=A0A2J7R830_9NEOP|nr:hypothetical protein B7P43_G08043 [Cryptotermes secundus]